MAQLGSEDLFGERVLDVLQDGALQRARSERRLVAEIDEARPRGGEQLELELAIHEELLEANELDVDDAGEVVLRERTEDDDVVDAVQELRAKEVLELFTEHVPQGLAQRKPTVSV